MGNGRPLSVSLPALSATGAGMEREWRETDRYLPLDSILIDRDIGVDRCRFIHNVYIADGMRRWFRFDL